MAGKIGTRKKDNLVFRNGQLDDIDGVYRIVKNSSLDDNSRYFYLMMLSYFSKDSAVVIDPSLENEARPDIVGFIVGLSSASQIDADSSGGEKKALSSEMPNLGPDDYFCWQVGVDDEYQGMGIARRLLDFVTKPYENLQATVTPSNIASMSLFESYARRHDKDIEKRVLFQKEHFGPLDHEEELLIDIK